MIVPEIIDQVAAEFWSSQKPAFCQKYSSRFQRGIQIAKEGKVKIEAGNHRRFRIKSSTPRYDHWYIADLNERTCSCPDSQEGYICKHRFAAFLIEKALAVVASQAEPVIDVQATQQLHGLSDVLQPPDENTAAAIAERQDKQPAEVMPLPEDDEPEQPVFDGINDPKPNPWLQPDMIALIEHVLSLRKVSLICAIAHYGGQEIPVEIETARYGQARVRTLPKRQDDGKLVGVYPFPNPDTPGGSPFAFAHLPITNLSNVCIQEA